MVTSQYTAQIHGGTVQHHLQIHPPPARESVEESTVLDRLTEKLAFQIVSPPSSSQTLESTFVTRLLIPRGQVPLQGSILQLWLDHRARLQESHQTGDPSFLRRYVLREVKQGDRPLESTLCEVSVPASLHPSPR
jgi:hypothetical protein